MNDTATLSRLFAGIQSDLDQVDATFEERATSGLEILNSASMHALGSPGKRLRTALTLLSGKMKTYRFDKLLPLSVAFEMVHLATLIHDDIVDNAKTRRGNPTVNALWGDNIAILLGDYYFAKTAGLIADINDNRIDHLFSDTVATVCEGTILEIMTAGRIDLTLETYFDKSSPRMDAISKCMRYSTAPPKGMKISSQLSIGLPRVRVLSKLWPMRRPMGTKRALLSITFPLRQIATSWTS